MALISMCGSISSLDAFINALANLLEVSQSFDFDALEEMISKVEKEINNLNENLEKANSISELIDEKHEQCDHKIDEYEKERDELSNKKAELNEKISDLENRIPFTKPPKREWLEAKLLKNKESLKRCENHLRKVEEELERLNGVKQLLDERKQDLEPIIDEIKQSTETMEEQLNVLKDSNNELEEIVNKLIEITTKAKETVERARNFMQKYLEVKVKKFEGSDGVYRFDNKFVKDDNTKLFGITENEKTILRKETGYSDTILKYVYTVEEARYYKSLGLVEKIVNGCNALLQPLKIDLDTPTEEMIFGKRVTRTNRERMLAGDGPMVNGERVELHHPGQKEDAPLVELLSSQHRGKGIYSELHRTNRNKSQVDRVVFALERRGPHWQDRYKMLGC